MRPNCFGMLEFEVGERFSWSGVQLKCVKDKYVLCSCSGCYFNSDSVKVPKSDCDKLACCPSERGDGVSCHFDKVKGGKK